MIDDPTVVGNNGIAASGMYSNLIRRPIDHPRTWAVEEFGITKCYNGRYFMIAQ
ncbi:hypothetical protein [Winogradskyella sp.]|uniref:hypothetical protein n=1 Tax=Winogradskyella sp. TaxID=1883156 RepID=UPI003BACF743